MSWLDIGSNATATLRRILTDLRHGVLDPLGLRVTLETLWIE